MREKAEKIINKSIYIVFICCITLILSIVVFVDKNISYTEACRLDTKLPNIVLLPIILIIIAGAFGIWKKYLAKSRIRKYIDKYFYWILIGFSILMLVFQWIYTQKVYFHAGWDVSIVLGSADKICMGKELIGEHYYYSQYTNNIAIVYILSHMQKLAVQIGMEPHRYLFCAIADCVLVNLAGFFTALSVKRVTGIKALSLFSYVLFILLIGINPWMVVPYTDTYSILFPILTFYLYLCFGQSERKPIKGVLWFLMNLVGFMGYLIKPSAAIVLIAVWVCEIVSVFYLQKDRWKRISVNILLAGLALVCIWGIRLHMHQYTGVIINEDIQLSFTHYLMMGLNEENTGSYYSEDYGFSSSFPDVESRTSANLQETLNRIKEYGPVGLLEFHIKKLLVNFNDGTFCWGREGGFIAGENPVATSLMSQRLKRLFYVGTDWYVYYATYAQTIWLSALSMLTGMFWIKKKGMFTERKEEIKVLLVSILGIIIFVTLFEARARYLYNMAPIIIVCASVGLYGWYKRIKTKGSQQSKIKE